MTLGPSDETVHRVEQKLTERRQRILDGRRRRPDFEFQIGSLGDLRAATLAARTAEAFASHMKPTENNHAAFARSQRDAIIKRVTEQLRPKYGQMYGYDASMPANVELAIRLVGSYY